MDIPTEHLPTLEHRNPSIIVSELLKIRGAMAFAALKLMIVWAGSICFHSQSTHAPASTGEAKQYIEEEGEEDGSLKDDLIAPFFIYQSRD